MTTPLTRRSFLRTVSGGAAGLALTTELSLRAQCLEPGVEGRAGTDDHHAAEIPLDGGLREPQEAL